MARRHELDLTQESSLCGDISIHIAEELEELEPGDILIVRLRVPREVVDDAKALLRETGIAEIIEEKRENDAEILVLRRL